MFCLELMTKVAPVDHLHLNDETNHLKESARLNEAQVVIKWKL